MITKEIINTYLDTGSRRIAYLMGNEKQMVSLLKKLIDNGIDLRSIIESSGQNDDYNEEQKEDISLVDYINENPSLRNEVTGEQKDEVTAFIENNQDFQEVSRLSRSWANLHFAGNKKRADTINGELDGLEISDQREIEKNTQKLLNNPDVQVIYEGQIQIDDLVARWDILVKTDEGYDVYEVKGSSVKYGPNETEYHDFVNVIDPDTGKSKGKSKFSKHFCYDLAFQYYVYNRAKLPIRSLNLVMLNQEFILNESEISYPIKDQYLDKLFVICKGIDVGRSKNTQEIVPLLDYIKDTKYEKDGYPVVDSVIIDVRGAINSKEIPDPEILYGLRQEPLYQVLNDIWDVPLDHIYRLTAYGLSGGSYRKNIKLIEEGVYAISDIKNSRVECAGSSIYDSFKLDISKDGVAKKSNAKMQILYSNGDCSKNTTDFIEFTKMRELFKQDYSVYPLIFFDFESMNYPLPLVANSWSWEQVCTQYSMHICEKGFDLEKHNFKEGKGGGITHYEYIGHPMDDGYKSPDYHLLEVLKAQFDEAHVDYSDAGKFKLIVYNKNFEFSRFKEMGKKYPEFAHLCAVCDANIVDMINFFQFGYWYRGDFKGRTSLKVTQPSITKDPYFLRWYKNYTYDISETLDYSKGLVHNGSIALDVYQSMVRANFKGEMDRTLHDTLIKELLHYCKIDSWGEVVMFDIIAKLLAEEEKGTLKLPVDELNILWRK